MKSLLPITYCLLCLIILSCERNDSYKFPKSYEEYLSDKIIEQIELREDEIFIMSYFFDRTNQPPYSSMLPVRFQITVINDKYFKYNERVPGGVMEIDPNGGLYLSSVGELFRIENSGDLIPVLRTDSFCIRDYTFDQQGNTWLTGDPGFLYWNGSERFYYNSSNSIIPTNITHGIAIDSFDVKWITLDFHGLLKITGNTWEIIENDEIPGLTESSYLYNPLTDNENRIWFHVHRPDTSYTQSNLLIYDGSEWSYSPPFESGNGLLKTDKYGNIWAINNEIEDGYLLNSSIYYYENETWVNYPILIPEKTMVITLNADEEHLYLGTTKGLYIMKR